MSDDPLDVNHFKQKLLHLHDSLTQVEQSGNEAAQTVESDQSTVGRLTRMDALHGQGIAATKNDSTTTHWFCPSTY